MLKIKGPRVLLKLDEVPETTQGGIILSTETVEKPQTGIVVEVGSGRLLSDGTTVPVEVSVGERVLFAKYTGTTLSHEGETLLLVMESDILAVVE